jgi:[NiFe] hydrogenase diaphorase moiety small subunit
MVVENDVPDLQAMRKDLVEMLFVEGNHFCMFCEKSGHCELQALAYRFGIAAPRFEYAWPRRPVDMSHPDIYIDHNRCILCGRCVRTSKEVDGKSVFQFVGRGHKKRLAVNSPADLGGTDAKATDAAVAACPVGALLKKRVGYATPVGRRPFDDKPIGSDVESTSKATKE